MNCREKEWQKTRVGALGISGVATVAGTFGRSTRNVSWLPAPFSAMLPRKMHGTLSSSSSRVEGKPATSFGDPFGH